jgi:LAO/AO transport system ATPase
MPELAPLLERFRRGDRLALSRLLSLAARGEMVHEIAVNLAASPGPRLIAITGSAGVGKSTLIGKLIEQIRKQNSKVAVLACDPQSPLSGGALLGDRFRMPSKDDDDGVFIRSLAALSGHGAVADHLPVMAHLLGAFGFNVVLLETVGAGQGDVTVSSLADVVVLLLQPETGDDLQWEKAGILEVADIVAVQKADLPRADQVAAQVRSILELGENRTKPVLLVSAKTGRGVAELWQTIVETVPRKNHINDAADHLLRLVHDQVSGQFGIMLRAKEPALDRLVEKWKRGEVSSHAAGIALLTMVISALKKEQS